METLAAIVMGIVEGITEFLPISSTGHLILADHLLGFEQLMGSKEAADAFTIVIQLGAILAVVVAFPRRFMGLLRLDDNRGLSGLRGIGLLVITSIPAALLGLVGHHFIKEHLFSMPTVLAALALGGLWILLVECFVRPPKIEGLDSIGWKHALSIGCFQCLALWPGMSRSASTILGGMMSGVERKTATEYSFLAAVPIMMAATGFEFYKSYSHLSAAHLRMVAVGFVVAFLCAWIAVKTFIQFLGRHTLMPFAWYRLIVAVLFGWAIFARLIG